MDCKIKLYKEQMVADTYIKVREFNNGIVIVVVDRDGKTIANGSLLSINKSGLHLHPNVSDKIGIATDDNGFIDVKYNR